METKHPKAAYNSLKDVQKMTKKKTRNNRGRFNKIISDNKVMLQVTFWSVVFVGGCWWFSGYITNHAFSTKSKMT